MIGQSIGEGPAALIRDVKEMTRVQAATWGRRKEVQTGTGVLKRAAQSSPTVAAARVTPRSERELGIRGSRCAMRRKTILEGAEIPCHGRGRHGFVYEGARRSSSKVLEMDALPPIQPRS